MKTDRTMSFHVAAWLLGGLVLAACGCGGGPAMPDGMPDLTPATATVTYNGQPVEGASVTLASKTGTYSAAGTTDATGKAVLKTNGEFDGVAPGDYLVTITKVEAAAAAGSGESSSDPAAYAAQFEAAPTKPKSLIPEKYATADTSGLTLTVGDSAIDQKFDLTD